MPELDGLDVTRRPSASNRPRTVIVTTSGLDETTSGLDEYVHAPPHGGASGFLLEDASPALQVEAAG